MLKSSEMKYNRQNETNSDKWVGCNNFGFHLEVIANKKNKKKWITINKKTNKQTYSKYQNNSKGKKQTEQKKYL